MTCGNIVSCNYIGWLVLLNITKLGACFLKLAIKDVEEGSVETHQYSNHSSLLVDAILIRYSSQHSIKEIINFVLSQGLRVAIVFIEEAINGVKKLLRLSPTPSLKTESARFTQYKRALREETHTLHHDFVRVPIVHQSGVDTSNLVSQHYILRTTVIFRWKGAK